MNETQLADAHVTGYGLLSELVGAGVGPHNRKRAEASAAVADALADYEDLQAAAEDHRAVFQDLVPPYEGTFLDPEGVPRAGSEARVRDTYRSIGFDPDPALQPPEHLATQLAALTHVTSLEADALRHGRAHEAQRAQDAARQLLDRHLLRWFPPFATAVYRSGRALPIALISQLEELLVLHRSALGWSSSSEEPAFELPPLDLAADLDSRPRIARTLTTPARSGIFLSREDLASLGRITRVDGDPHEPSTMLEHVLDAARLQGTPERVQSRLLVLLSDWRDALEAPQYATVPEVAPLLRPWCQRIEETARLLRQLDPQSLTEGS